MTIMSDITLYPLSKSKIKKNESKTKNKTK